MISLPLEKVFLIPLFIGLVVVLGSWCYYSFKAYRTYGRSKRRARLYRCERCVHVYIDHREVPLTRCPSCGSLNEAVRQ